MPRRQAYWVCALIEESDALQANAAGIAAAQLREAFADLKVGLFTGSWVLAEMMTAFATNRIDIWSQRLLLRSAWMSQCKHDDYRKCGRFGLAQLHRVGGWLVGAGKPLLAGISITPQPNRQATSCSLRESQDRFVIAEKDLSIRGPGEVLGTRDRTFIIRVARLPEQALLGKSANCPRAGAERPQTGRTIESLDSRTRSLCTYNHQKTCLDDLVSDSPNDKTQRASAR